MNLNWIKIRHAISHFCSPPEPKRTHNKIIIFLPVGHPSEPLGKVDWLLADPQGIPLQTVMDGNLAQLQPAENDEIIVVVPAQAILLTQTTIPPLSTYRLQQALPFALEEQVLDELELLHFAPGPYLQSIPGVAVAIVKKSLLEHWLTLLQQAGVQPDRITPAIFALPYQDNQWQLLLSGNIATVRTGLYAGFSSELGNLETLLSCQLQETGTIPEKLVIHHDKNLHFSLHSLALPTEQIVLNKKQTLALAAASLEQYPALNLLQTPYTSQRKHKIPEKNKRAWQLTAIAFSLWLGLSFLSKFGSLLILSYQHQHLQKIITATYHVYFPQTSAAINPQARMETKLKQALATSKKNRFFQWLGYLAKASSSIRIQSLHFQNDQLSLELVAPSFASLDEFILSLKAQGLEVKQQSAAMAGNQVKALLFIEDKST